MEQGAAEGFERLAALENRPRSVILAEPPVPSQSPLRRRREL